ncbi:MAG: GntR family transcriptional regulator [Acetatifactor sp.]|nr:GntR family transcriptional regulator [Acetatifactor sp.]
MKILQNTGEPIYLQISRQFKEDILAGKLKQGEYLPSIRSLAKDLKISVITTMKAYEQLETEGLVTGVQGKGFYVNAQDSQMLREQHLRRVEESLTEAITAARIAGMTSQELREMMETLLQYEDDSFCFPTRR